ncbi:MAG TPA: PKD domain-containing protein [Methylococcaceae bacterium]|nr:PKD domain-containing protein [Methylococcaceae bacterium]
MKTQVLVATAVLAVLAGCASPPKQKEVVGFDPSKQFPPSAAGIPAESRFFPTADAAEKALAGYNYELIALPEGGVQAIVTGLHGSGLGNPLASSAGVGQSGAAASGGSADAEEYEKPFPKIVLKEKTHGKAAIEALGDRIGDVARAYDMTPERLAEILSTDPTAWIDEGGRLLYIDTAPDLPEGRGAEETATTEGTLGSAATTTATDPFALHSKPGSNRVIYLDFNGYVATNTAWYSGTLNAQAYDIDGNASEFSTTERDNIRNIWQRIAEDFAPFDVDVTTEEPAPDALRRTGSGDAQYGTRAVITRSMPQLCNQSCGGVAYVNAFSWYSSSSPDYYQPAWVFFDKLGNGWPKYVAEAASHEVGHNLNLYHDGTSSVGYYSGHGSGATGWAPIMGVGYYQTVTQWSKGEYPGANNAEDDVAKINSAGAPLRADDHANSIASAAPLGGDAAAVSQTGLIERNTDVDVFGFTSGGGTAQFAVTPDTLSPNLDVLLKVLDAQGNAVAQANPVDALPASLSASLGQGQYYLQVEGAGKGDLTTGYSDYGSLGQYTVSGSYPQQTGSGSAAPTAVLSALPASGYAPLNVSFEGGSSTDSDGTIAAYDWNFGDGTTGSGASVAHTYNAVGNYTATLTVTDNSGLQDGATQAIQVTQSPVAVSMKVSSTTVSRQVLNGGKSRCVAKVAVTYESSPLINATAYGNWSGTVKTSSVKASTGKTGTATFISPTTTAKSGTCAFTVSKVTKTGYTYDSSGTISGSFTW